jgi:hypothetical protein
MYPLLKRCTPVLKNIKLISCPTKKNPICAYTKQVIFLPGLPKMK